LPAHTVARAGKDFYQDEISVSELSKSISLETYAPLPFDTLEQAERFVTFLKAL
jgi:hypothetical protein